MLMRVDLPVLEHRKTTLEGSRDDFRGIAGSGEKGIRHGPASTGAFPVGLQVDCQFFWKPRVIAIQKGQVLTLGFPNPAVSGCCDPAILLLDVSDP